MSETDPKPNLLNAKHVSSINYDQLIKSAAAQAESEGQPFSRNDYQPVEREAGRETLAKTREAISIFVTEYLPTLPMGEKTRAALDAKISHELALPDGVLATSEHVAQYRFDDYEPFDPATPKEQPATLALGRPLVETATSWVNRAATASQTPLDSDKSNQIAYAWITWDELGHALQEAYATATYVPGEPPGSLEGDMINQGVSPKFFPEASSKFQAKANIAAESEAFPEGFAQMLVEDYLRRHLGLTSTQSAKFRTELTPPERKESLYIEPVDQRLH